MGCKHVSIGTAAGCREIVRDNQDGILVPLGDIAAAARALTTREDGDLFPVRPDRERGPRHHRHYRQSFQTIKASF
jgi:glycosyltransferase involved in cell wall biosynthesis